MEILAAIASIAIIIVSCWWMLSVPMTWYHVGNVSRKLSTIIELLEKEKKND